MRLRAWCVVVCIMCLAFILNACGAGASDNAHGDEVGTWWDRDAVQHWQLDSDGNKINAAEHNLVDDVHCDVCGSEIIVFDDGSVDIYNYNEFDEWIRITSLDPDGDVISENSYEYGHNENGDKLWQKQYYFNVLVEEVIFTYNDDSECVPAKQINYDEFGGYTEILFDDYYNVLKQTSYDANGMVLYLEENAYLIADEDYYYMSKQTITWSDGSKLVSEFNQYEDTILREEFDGEGNLVTKSNTNYEYDENGNRQRAEYYVDDVLVSVAEYAMTDDSYNYTVKEIIYNEDGSYSEFIYDENEELVEEIIYDAEGNVIEE